MTALTPSLILTAFVVFCRIGGCLLMIPGFSSSRLSMRPRLFVAIGIALALTPMLLPQVQPIVENATPISLLTVIFSESLKGILIGLLGRIFFVALETMTMATSLSIGLSSAFANPTDEQEQMPTVVSLVTLAATLLIFVTDLHWEVFRGLSASYSVLPVKISFDPRVGLNQLVSQTSRIFLFTLRIASPFLVFSIVANFALGLINKLVPQIPISFIAAPFLIAGGLILFYFAVGPAIDLFLTAFGDFLRSG